LNQATADHDLFQPAWKDKQKKKKGEGGERKRELAASRLSIAFGALVAEGKDNFCEAIARR